MTHEAGSLVGDDPPPAIDRILAEARAGLERVEQDLDTLMAAGAFVVDTRPVGQRERDGELPGAVVIDRDVLEWRLDPTSPDRIPEATDAGRRVIVVCNEGCRAALRRPRCRRSG